MRVRLRLTMSVACACLALGSAGDPARSMPCLSTVPVPLSARRQPIVVPYDPFENRRRWTESSNSTLPPHVPGEKGAVTLYADYAHRDGNGTIPVYFINGIGLERVFSDPTGGAQLYLEVLDATGRWIRAQPQAFKVICGVGLRHKLGAGRHLRIQGYQPPDGRSQLVRFSFYNQEFALSSNVGRGLASQRDIELAANDALNVIAGDFEFLAEVALGERILNNQMNDFINDSQVLAIHWVYFSRNFDDSERRQVLEQVHKRFPEQLVRAKLGAY